LAELAVTLVYHSAKAKFDMKQWIAFWMLGSIWGSSFLLIKIAVDELGVFPLVAIRVGIAGIIMLIYLGVTGRLLLKTRTDLLNVILVGIFNVALPFTLITRAEESIDSSLATILNATVPLFSLIFAHFVLHDDRLTRERIAGLVIGYIGIVILASRGLSDTGNSPISGQIMMLIAASSYAMAVVYIRARMRHIEPIRIAGLSLVVAAIIMAPLSLIFSDVPDVGALSTDTLWAIGTLGTVNTVVAYFLWYYLISEWGARATLVTYTFPPIGVTLGAIFLDELVDIRLVIGALLILGGIFVVNFKRKRRQSVQTAPPRSPESEKLPA
jgi:drug/metabolite transporter (DMT)-like permease